MSTNELLNFSPSNIQVKKDIVEVYFNTGSLSYRDNRVGTEDVVTLKRPAAFVLNRLGEILNKTDAVLVRFTEVDFYIVIERLLIILPNLQERLIEFVNRTVGPFINEEKKCITTILNGLVANKEASTNVNIHEVELIALAILGLNKERAVDYILDDFNKGKLSIEEVKEMLAKMKGIKTLEKSLLP